MKKIAFSDKYKLTQAVLEGKKTMTRRIVPESTIRMAEMEANLFKDELKARIKDHAPYCFHDEVAIAQRYRDRDVVLSDPIFFEGMRKEAGWNNKMFVRADFMPHRIRITGIKVERLQDISEEDCIKEGIEYDSAEGSRLWWYDIPGCQDRKLQNTLMRHEWDGKKGLWFWDTPQGAFSALIDCISGKGTWDTNPLVYAYSFELIK